MPISSFSISILRWFSHIGSSIAPCAFCPIVFFAFAIVKRRKTQLNSTTEVINSVCVCKYINITTNKIIHCSLPYPTLDGKRNDEQYGRFVHVHVNVDDGRSNGHVEQPAGDSASSTLGDAQFWEETIIPSTIRTELAASDPSNPNSRPILLKCMKWLLASISKGRDGSELYPHVVKLVGPTSLEVFAKCFTCI
jgi:hypothetical protein